MTYDDLYAIWKMKIVERLKFTGYTSANGKEELLNHLWHHIEEFKTELKGVPTREWIVSLIILAEILADVYEHSITAEKKCERLYAHYLKDPQHTEPPPIERYLFDKEKHQSCPES